MKNGRAAYRCRVEQNQENRILEIPQWMFESAVCGQLCMAETPTVNCEALQDLKGLLRSARLSGANLVLQAQHRCLLSPGGSDAKVAEPMEASSNSTFSADPQESTLGKDPARNQTKDSETAGPTAPRTLGESFPSDPGTGRMR